MARQVDVCEHGSKRVISVPFAGNGLNIVDKFGDLAFVGVQINPGPLAELVDQVEKGDHVLHRVGDESVVVRVPLAGQVQVARGDVISLIRGA